MWLPRGLQATQKGDPVVILKRQLEEKEKLLATEQEDAAALRASCVELNKVGLGSGPSEDPGLQEPRAVPMSPVLGVRATPDIGGGLALWAVGTRLLLSQLIWGFFAPRSSWGGSPGP